MRKFFILILVLAIAALGYLGYAHFSGGAVPTFGLPIGGEKAKIRVLSVAFFENVKFKNSSALIHYVENNSSIGEIASYLTKTFGVDADQVDLIKVVIKDIELDSLGTRARVKVELRGHNQLTNKAFDIEKIIFLYKVGEKWLVDIKSLSL
jgi:hypothetical protein